MSWCQVLVALACTSFMVQGSPCTWVEVISSWRQGYKAVAKIQMEETVDHWDVDIEFSESIINFEAWKGEVTKSSNKNYTVSNTCYNNMVYSCQCFELPYLVRHKPMWEGNTTFMFNGKLVPACISQICYDNSSSGAEKMGESMMTFYTEKVPEFGNENIKSFEDKIKWANKTYSIGNINITTDILSGDQHITDVVSKVWDILITSKDQKQVDEGLEKLKNGIKDDVEYYLIESARTIYKIMTSGTKGEQALDALWSAATSHTEKQNISCGVCNETFFNEWMYKNTTLGTIAGCKKQLGLVSCTEGALAGMMKGAKGFIDYVHHHECPICECCFSGTGKVETMSGIKKISELIIGDFVKTSSGPLNIHFTEFLGWLGREKTASVAMLKVFTCQGCPSMTLSGNHVVFTPNSTKYADELQLGDFLVYFDGSMILNERVTQIQKTVGVGSFAPLTRDGTLIVDGYLASCYASFPHWAVDLALAPVKAMPKMLLDDEESQHQDGPRLVTKLFKRLGEMSGFRERNLNKMNEGASPTIDERIQLNSPIFKSEL